jgi:chemotaxis protein MotB
MAPNHSYTVENFEEDSGEDMGWMVTFSDLVTLLLVFFILLYSISSLNMEKFKHAMSSIQVSLGEDFPPVALLEIVQAPQSNEGKFSLEDITGLVSREQEILSDLREFIEEKQLGQQIQLTLFEGKISLQIRGQVIFPSGKAQLNPAALPILDDIIDIVDAYAEYKVNIKGHTDNIPISTPEFPSNWELSSIRATKVLKHMIKGGIDPSRLTATGYGSLLPLVANNSSENRSRNRRVEFVLEKSTQPR